MKKLNTSPISGMQELLPEKQALFDKLKNEIARVYHAHGFLSIETPTIERAEILLAKAGGDTEKQIYKVFKTAETADDADQALRFDHTVPLARYVVEHENDLTFPFKVTQIGRNFRGERAQKGRFREFYQLDVDVIGRNNLGIAYDAEVVKTAYDALKTFIKPEMKIRISNRKILTGLLQELGLQTKSADIFSIIDHAEKVPKEKTLEAYEEIGLSKNEIETLVQFSEINGDLEKVKTELNKLNIKNETFKLGVEELVQVLGLLEKQGMKDIAIGDMLIVRGLDYYTGSVFETFLPEYREIGSICSGGRYENLAGNYTDQSLPGVGISIGLTRLFYVLNANNLLEEESEKPIDIVLIPFSENEYEYTFRLADNLRGSGKKVDINLTDKKVGDKFAYSGKIAKFASVIGEREVETGNIEIKNLETGEKIKLEDYIRNV
ncbi:histidine--tRNA ligase [Candidatus Saccharibacteria bacterium]|nr:histidine--tRNA ligase [Candidatus Saccharibacteria bacterium]